MVWRRSSAATIINRSLHQKHDKKSNKRWFEARQYRTTASLPPGCSNHHQLVVRWGPAEEQLVKPPRPDHLVKMVKLFTVPTHRLVGGRLWWFGNASRFPRFFLCNCESRSYWWLSVIDGVRCCCKMVKLTPAPRYRVTPALLQELQSFQWIPNIIRPNSLLWWNSEIDPSDSSPTKWHRVGQSGDCRQIVERSRWGCKTCQVVSKSGTRCPRWHRWWHQVYPSPWHHLAWHPSPPQLCQCHRSLSQKKFGCAEIYAKYGKLDHRKSTHCLLIFSWIWS